MKKSRFLACGLALLLLFSLLVLPASAAFSDVKPGYWAESYINDMTAKGMFKGYPDGSFQPAGKLTAAEALTLCARLAVAEPLRKQIGTDRSEEMKTILGEELAWFYNDAATCLEAGIVTATELRGLYQAGALTKGLTKEDFAFYLVRAMQLGPMAAGLTTYSLDFSDTAAIALARQPSVYLLNIYGIVTGDEKKAFQPKNPVSREVSATMISRALGFMEKRGTVVELPEYTDYAWVAGSIAAVTAGDKGVVLLTLESPLTGTKTISLPSEISVFENSMLVGTGALKPGLYARVCMDEKDAAFAVRLSGALTTHTGGVVSISNEAVLMNENGAARTMEIDRFTQVQVGKATGDRALIDLAAGYTNAVCRVDSLGKLVSLQLTGGTRQESGLIGGVEPNPTGGVTLVVSGFNGTTQRYVVPQGAAVTANGFAVTELNSSYLGSYVALRVSNETGAVATAAVDSATKYIQGALRGTSYESAVNTVTITNTVTGTYGSRNMAPDVVITYNGAPIAFKDLQRDWYVTARLSGNEVVMLAAYPGSAITEGTVAFINYGTTVVMGVKRPDGATVTFDLDVAALPTIKRDGKTSSIDKLKTGDTVAVTVRYNAVTNIEAKPQMANVSGTIERITMESTGIIMDVTHTDGTKATYTVGAGVSVTQDGKASSVFDLKNKYQIAMVVNGGQVSSIEVNKMAATGSELSGTILFVNTSEKTILFKAVDAAGNVTPVTVAVPYDTTIRAMDGTTLSLSKLSVGDALQIFGGYEGLTFQATIIVKK